MHPDNIRNTMLFSLLHVPTGHIHQERPNASICSGFLVGQCKRGVNCSDHHCSLPYQWQYKAANVDVWRSFSDQDNLALEKLYCDVNTESRVNFKPSQALDLSLLKRQVITILCLVNFLIFLRTYFHLE